MGLFDFLRKRQDTPDKYVDASVTVMDRAGRPKQPQFNYHAAVRHYSSWIYAAATINAQAVAANPLRLYVRSKPGAKRLYDTRPVPKRRKAYLMGDTAVQPSRSVMRKAIAGDFEEVSFDHPVLEVLRKANSMDDGFGLAISRILFLELTGNAYLHPVFGDLGVPAELWTMPSQYVKVIPSTDGLIAGYRYGVEAQTEMDFATDEVIHFRRPNPKSLLYGMGKVEAAWGVIQQNAAIHDMDLSMFENMARPDYAIIVKSAGREQLDRFETKVREALQGTRKAGKFFAMSGDVDMKPLSFPTKDLAGRDEIVEEIAAVFGVPVSMLKANDPNLAASKSGYAQWRESTIAPICRLDEETLNAKLLPLFGLQDDAYLAYDNPVPADRQQDLVERQTAVAGGWMTPNEARIESGYEPSEDAAADRLYVNGQPLGGQPQGVPGVALPFGAPRVMPEPQAQAWEDPTVEPVQASKRLSLPAPATKSDDCVSDKIRTLLDEGYPREQAIAIAISMCEGKAWGEADPAKAIGDVDTRPTEEMARLAARGLELRAEFNRGGTEVGVARARDISNRANLSEETIRRMASYFSRHRVDLDAEGAQSGEDGYPTAGAIAWMLWGGDPNDADSAGAAWAQRKQDEIDRAREKSATRSAIAEYVNLIDGRDEASDRKAIDTLLATVTKSLDPVAVSNAKMLDYLLNDEDTTK
jgi:HK97 family phage portal protein